MTDFAATPSGGIGEHALAPTTPVAVWEPAPTATRRRTGLWIGLGIGALVVVGSAVALSTVLIAPGTTVAGVAVGGLTPGDAAEKISQSIAATEVTFTGAGTAATVTAGALGASVDALALTQQVHSAHPMWNLGQWHPEPVVAPVALDSPQAEDELRAAVPSVWEDPTDATVVFDAEANAFVTTPAAVGSGLDLEALAGAIDGAVSAGEATLSFPATPIDYAPAISDEHAAETAQRLNAMLAAAGFYVGEERVVPVEPATFASWFDIVAGEEGLELEPDAAAIQATVDTLAEKVDRDPVHSSEVVNSKGKVLRFLEEGQVGRQLLAAEAITPALAEQLRHGEARYALSVNETPYETTQVVRTIDVNLRTQRLTMLENGEAIDSWRISSGKDGFLTKTGNYTIGWKTPKQNMGREDLTVRPYYYVENVKWVMYFNGNQAFHGVYWHSSWGTRMSHGCVGMPESRAKQLYDWSPEGVEISIHY